MPRSSNFTVGVAAPIGSGETIVNGEGNNVNTLRTGIDKELYEGCDEEGPIISIMFAEFHPTQGPIVRCQVPEKEDGQIPKDVFDAIAVYIIPKPELTSRSVTLNVHDWKICGFPVVINDEKYKRNQFIFNVCFICYPWSRTVQFEPVLRKFSNFLLSLELEMEFLSSDEETPLLKELMEGVFTQLTAGNHAVMQVGKHMLNLKVVSCKTDPPKLNDWDVPVLVVDKNVGGHWDLTTAQILSYINGINYIVKIAALADVDTNLAKSCVANLVYHRVVEVIDHVFQFNNEYMVTPEIRLFRENSTFQAEFMEYLFEDPIPKRSLPKTAKFSDIFRLIGQFKHGMSVKDICIRYRPKQTLGIDISRLVQYLVLKRILHRLHHFPYHKKFRQGLTIANCSFDDPIYLMFDGQHHMDEICLRFRRSPLEVKRMIDRNPDVHVLVK